MKFMNYSVNNNYNKKSLLIITHEYLLYYNIASEICYLKLYN